MFLCKTALEVYLFCLIKFNLKKYSFYDLILIANGGINKKTVRDKYRNVRTVFSIASVLFVLFVNWNYFYILATIDHLVLKGE